MRATRITHAIVLAAAWTSGCVMSAPEHRPQPLATTGREWVRPEPRKDQAAPLGKQVGAVVPSPDCRAGTSVLLSTLQGIARAPRLVVDRASLPAVSPGAPSSGRTISAACALVTVSSDAVSFEGAPVAGADDAARARTIATLWRRAARRRPRPTTLCVAAPGATSLARVETLVGRLGDVVLLAVAAPSGPSASAPSIEQTLRAIEAAPSEGRCAAFVDGLERAVGTCDAARTAVRALVQTTPACTSTPAQGAGIDESRGVTDALAACECGGADTAAIVRLYERAADRVGPTLRAFPLHGDLYAGAGLEGALAESAGGAPTTVIERVRLLEQQRDFRGH